MCSIKYRLKNCIVLVVRASVPIVKRITESRSLKVSQNLIDPNDMDTVEVITKHTVNGLSIERTLRYTRYESLQNYFDGLVRHALSPEGIESNAREAKHGEKENQKEIDK